MKEPSLVLHTKFAAYLGWSQPFLHRLIAGLEEAAPGAVLCNRRENRDRFPLTRFACASTQSLIRPGAAALLAEALREAWAPRLVHAHFGWSGIRSLLLRQCLGVPLVTTFGGRDLGADLADPRQRPLYERLLQASDLCFCVSEALAGMISECGVEDDRIRVVRRGADVSFFEPVERGPRESEPLRILMIGRLVEKKGHRDAIAALSALVDAGHDCVLRIVGAGDREPIREEADRLGVGARVQLEGSTDAAGVRDHFAWADLLLHCSRRARDGDVEGIPNVIVEAAATGLPVVGTRHGGIAEVVCDGQTGWLVPEAEPKAIAEAVASLVADVPRRRAMGDAAARWVRARATLDAQIDAHLSAYDLLAGVIPRAARLDPSFTRQMAEALQPAVDAELLHASRWVARSWVSEPRPVRRLAASVSQRNREARVARDTVADGEAADGDRSLRDRVRRFGAAWAERPQLGLPMRAYRGVRQAWVAAAQRREDERAWQALDQGLRLELRAPGADRALRTIFKEGPTGCLDRRFSAGSTGTASS